MRANRNGVKEKKEEEWNHLYFYPNLPKPFSWAK